MLAPVVVFVYNRPDHIKQTLSQLQKNDLAKQSELFVFSDGPKNNGAIEKVEAVREYINSKQVLDGFKSVTVFESRENKGLANSIISGVSKIIEEYGKVIVLEDDSYSTPDYLKFMNDCLEFYETNSKIWSIGGFSHISIGQIPDNYTSDVYIMGRTCSYAWATWLDRWEKVDWEVEDYSNFIWNFPKRFRFNRYGRDRSFMLDEQMTGVINSWAIRFCYSMFSNEMYTLLPISTKIKTIGRDGSGTHTLVANTRFDVTFPETAVPYKLEDVVLDNRLVKSFGQKFDYGILTNIRKYIKTLFRILTKGYNRT